MRKPIALNKEQIKMRQDAAAQISKWDGKGAKKPVVKETVDEANAPKKESANDQKATVENEAPNDAKLFASTSKLDKILKYLDLLEAHVDSTKRECAFLRAEIMDLGKPSFVKARETREKKAREQAARMADMIARLDRSHKKRAERMSK